MKTNKKKKEKRRIEKSKLGDVLAFTRNLRQGQEPLNYELGLTYIAKSHFLLLLERRDLSRKAKSHLL
jgi:hypothetical protein